MKFDMQLVIAAALLVSAVTPAEAIEFTKLTRMLDVKTQRSGTTAKIKQLKEIAASASIQKILDTIVSKEQKAEKLNNFKNWNLDLYAYSNLEKNHLEAIFNALPSCTKLKKLSLGYTNLSTVNAALFKNIESLSNLVLLDLRHSQLTTEQLTNVFSVLPSCKKLQYLYLSDNDLSGVSAVLFKNIESLSDLVDLNLSACKLTAEQESLAKNFTLKAIS